MTGCYPKRVLSIPGVLFPGNDVGLAPGEVTLAEVLQEVGYATGCIGKWHLGDQPPFLPTRQGFDYYYGIPYSNDMGPVVDGAQSNLGEPLEKNVPNKGQASKHPPIPLMRGETVIERVGAQQQSELVVRYTDQAVQFIRDHQSEPFFLYLPHNAVHFPIYPGKEFQGKSPHGIYSDWVEEVDWSVGKVLDTVRELKLADKTLVLFTSDNGGTPRAVNAPLRGHKNSTWEGGVRVPTIAWWPGQVPAGTTTNEITGMMDILPTFVKLASGTVPAGRKLDGGDIWPLLSGQRSAKSPHEVFYYFRGLRLEAVRSGPWKLHLATTELYHLPSDIGESKNVAKANPEVVERLTARAEQTKDDLGLEGIGPGCRPLGKVARAQPLISHEGKIREGFGSPSSP